MQTIQIYVHLKDIPVEFQGLCVSKCIHLISNAHGFSAMNLGGEMVYADAYLLYLHNANTPFERNAFFREM